VAAECAISAMPTFQMWKDGKKVQEVVGASKPKLKELADAFAA
jgi:thioredoxin 1